MPLLKSVAAFLGRKKHVNESAPATPPHARPRVLLEGDRLKRLLTISSFLPDLTREDAQVLVMQTTARFSRRVYDVPASERDHHNGRWGLLDHSLEVAEYAVRCAASSNFCSNGAPDPQRQAYRVPRLRYGAFLLALFHDVGKILHFIIQGGQEAWNPWAEDLADFTERHSIEATTPIWRAGRGADAHVWHTQSLLVRIGLPREAADYLGAKLVSDLLEGTSEDAVQVRDIVKKADSKSTREDNERKARERETPDPPKDRSTYFTPQEGYVELVPRAFSDALGESVFSMNALEADLFIGTEYIAFRYPDALKKLASFLRERLGPVSQLARSLQVGEAGARELAHHMNHYGGVYTDPQGGAWKLSMAVTHDGCFASAPAGVLVRRSFLLPGAEGRDLPVFQGGLSLRRTTDHAELAVGGFHAPQRAAPVSPSPKTDPTPPASKAPPARIAPPKARPAISQARMPQDTVSPQQLLSDIRELILTDQIPTNLWNGQVYVQDDATYLVYPHGLSKLVELNYYSIDPSRKGGTYLNALKELDCVRTFGAGRTTGKASFRKGAGPCVVIVFETRGLFRTDAELAHVGTWPEEITFDDSGPEKGLFVKNGNGTHAD